MLYAEGFETTDLGLYAGNRYGGGDPLVDQTLGDGVLRLGDGEASSPLAVVPLRVQGTVVGALVGMVPATAEAGAWVLPRGRTDVQVAFLHQDTTDRYFLDGDRIPYFFDGRNRYSRLCTRRVTMMSSSS